MLLGVSQAICGPRVPCSMAGLTVHACLIRGLVLSKAMMVPGGGVLFFAGEVFLWYKAFTTCAASVQGSQLPGWQMRSGCCIAGRRSC